MLPVGEAGHDDAVEIPQDGVERFGRLRRVGGQRRFYFAGRGPRPYRALGHAGPLVGHAVDDLVAEAAKLFGSHKRLLFNIARRTETSDAGYAGKPPRAARYVKKET